MSKSNDEDIRKKEFNEREPVEECDCPKRVDEITYDKRREEADSRDQDIADGWKPK